MTGDSDNVVFLGVPPITRTVADVLGAAGHMDLKNCLVLSQREDGSLVWICTDFTLAEANWLLDMAKNLLMPPRDSEHPKAG
jgi:hypothetical protein